MKFTALGSFLKCEYTMGLIFQILGHESNQINYNYFQRVGYQVKKIKNGIYQHFDQYQIRHQSFDQIIISSKVIRINREVHPDKTHLSCFQLKLYLLHYSYLNLLLLLCFALFDEVEVFKLHSVVVKHHFYA